VNKLLKITEFYPNDFIDEPEVALHTQLKNYDTNVLCDPKFAKLRGIFVQNLRKQISANNEVC